MAKLTDKMFNRVIEGELEAQDEIVASVNQGIESGEVKLNYFDKRYIYVIKSADITNVSDDLIKLPYFMINSSYNATSEDFQDEQSATEGFAKILKGSGQNISHFITEANNDEVYIGSFSVNNSNQLSINDSQSSVQAIILEKLDLVTGKSEELEY